MDITDIDIGVISGTDTCLKCSDTICKSYHKEYHVKWDTLSITTQHCSVEVNNKLGYVWPASKAAKLLYSKAQKNKKGQDTNLPRRRG